MVLFNKFIGGKSGRVIAAAAPEYDGIVLSANEIDYYHRLLCGNTLLGVGGGSSARKGAPLRTTYVRATVRRTLRESKPQQAQCSRASTTRSRLVRDAAAVREGDAPQADIA